MRQIARNILKKIKQARARSVVAIWGKRPRIRFMILASARSGSNFLHYALKSHQNIQMLGEVFNLQAASAPMMKKLLLDPVKYADKLLNRKCPKGKMALGFKLFYNQMTPEQVDCEFYSTYFIQRNDVSHEEAAQIDKLKGYIANTFDVAAAKARIEDVWSYFQKDTGIKILHLRRNNRLKQYLSICRAWQSNEWISMKSGAVSQAPLRPIRIEYLNCLGFFEKLGEWEKKFGRHFSRHEVHEVFYEDLARDPGGELEKVQTFLGLPLKRLDAQLQKQRREPVSEAIANYGELKARFKGSPYEEYFSNPQ